MNKPMTKNTQGSELREKIERIDVGDQNDKGCTITLGELLDYKSIDLIWEVADQAITSSNRALLRKVREIVDDLDISDVVIVADKNGTPIGESAQKWLDGRKDALDDFLIRLAELEKEHNV